jgi:hypothetical protein
MGTSADFYIGTGKRAQFLGSVGIDGYPRGIDRNVLKARTADDFRSAVSAMLLDGRSAYVPTHADPDIDSEVRVDDAYGGPFGVVPRSRLHRATGSEHFTYVFERGKVRATLGGGPWFDPLKYTRRNVPDSFYDAEPEGGDGVLVHFNAVSGDDRGAATALQQMRAAHAAHPTRPRTRDENRYGMTYDEWAAAAGIVPFGGYDFMPADVRDSSFRAWQAGEDPTDWRHSGAHIDALADVERALPAPVAQHSGALALGLGGLALLGVAGYFAFRGKVPPAAGSASNVLKAPAPTPSKPATSHAAPAAHPAPAAPRVPTPAQAAPHAFAASVGQHVDAVWTDGNYYPGRVAAVDGSGRYQIAWDDGGAPTWVTASQLHASAAPAPSAPAVGTMSTAVKGAGPLAECISRGGDQVDENGNCFKGDERIP